MIAVLVFLATEVLPGNAARAALGRNATPVALHALEHRLGLDRSLVAQFWSWLSGILTGHLGASLTSGQPVWGVHLAPAAQLGRCWSPPPGSSARWSGSCSARPPRCAGTAGSTRSAR